MKQVVVVDNERVWGRIGTGSGLSVMSPRGAFGAVPKVKSVNCVVAAISICPSSSTRVNPNHHSVHKEREQARRRSSSLLCSTRYLNRVVHRARRSHDPRRRRPNRPRLRRRFNQPSGSSLFLGPHYARPLPTDRLQTSPPQLCPSLSSSLVPHPTARFTPASHGCSGRAGRGPLCLHRGQWHR